MANSSLSVKKCVISYLDLYQNWIRNDHDQNNGQSTIPVMEISREMLLSTLLNNTEYETVCSEKTAEDKLIKLFNTYMPGKGKEGFEQVVDYLYKNNYIGLANDLVTQMQKCLPFRIHLDDGVTTELNQIAVDGHQTTLTISKSLPIPHSFDAPLKLQNSLMTEAQEYLSKFITHNVDFMADIWSGLIQLPRTYSTFVDVQILEDFKDDKGKAVHEYKEVFKSDTLIPFKRILIQGDPGCGKSTYVNKIALDWAEKNEYLRENFHLLFLIPLQTLSTNPEQAIRTLLPQRSIGFFADYYKHHSSKVLLILDGFDELPEDSQFYSEVMRILNGQMSQFQFFTIVITTRRSHVDKIPQRYHGRSLLIKGFDEKSMKQFLQIQNVPVPDEQTDANLVVLLQNPFFCAIYCSLHYFEVDKSKLEDPYDFVKALVENAVKIEKEAKGITNDKDLLLLLGAFAFQKLNSETLNVVEKLFPMSFLSKMANIFKKKPKHVQRIDTDKIQLGLLIKKKIPAVGVEYKEEFSFPHQLIAEYLAARYFIRSTKSQLKQLQPKKLVQGELSAKLRLLILSSPSSLPFVRFLLFEYLNWHLNDARNGRELIFRFLTDEFRFICYCKSKSETQAINDIISLDCMNIGRDIRHDNRFFPTLTKCHNLTSLNLADYNLSTHEATEVVKLFQENCLPKLTKFSLSDNRNVGSTPALFAALGKCKHLERLELQCCALSIESINRLTTCINDNCWVKLSQLDLLCNINVGSTPALFTTLGKCKQLERVDLGGCYLSIESINRFTTCIDDNCWVKLSQLNLSNNNNVNSTPALFIALGKCKHLERLELALCDLSIESVNRLTTCIDDTCWVTLVLSINRNVGSTPALFAALGKLKQLEGLDLQCCDLSIESIDQLTACIDDNCWVKLHQLVLSQNIHVGSTPALFTALGKCKQLERLYLIGCDLSIESINRLTACINDNCWVKLSQLDLSYNINVGSTSALFAALGECKQLEGLYLIQCDLSIESINRLTTCIDDNCWPKLSQLVLLQNKYIGSTPALFAALGKCKQLERLDLGCCYLSIESINRLTTCIDDNSWPNLATLDLLYNAVVGRAKELFRVLYKSLGLRYLNISSCSMTNQSMKTFLSTFNSNTFQELENLTLNGNMELKIDHNFYLSLLGCSKLSTIRAFIGGPTEWELSISGQKAKKALLDRGCKIY